MTSTQLRGILIASLVALALSFAGQQLRADFKIVVDFNNTDNISESNGTKYKASAAGYDAGQKAAVLNMVKSKYTGIAGLGTVSVVEGAVGTGLGGGDYSVVVSGGKGPGTKFGNAGVAGAPSIVYGGIFADEKKDGNPVFTGVGLTNAVGETTAHEAGHRAGKFGHNGEDPAAAVPNVALMRAGGDVTNARRIADQRGFNTEETKAISTNYVKKVAAAAAGLVGAGVHGLLGGFAGDVVGAGANDFIPDDDVWSAQISYLGAPGMTVGYVDQGGSFVAESTNLFGMGAPDYMGMLFPGSPLGSWDMALQDSGGSVYDFLHFGASAPLLTQPDPYNSGVYQMAQLPFSIGGTSFSILLDATATLATTGGFLQVPEPACIALLGIVLGGFAIRRGRQRVRAV